MKGATPCRCEMPPDRHRAVESQRVSFRAPRDVRGGGDQPASELAEAYEAREASRHAAEGWSVPARTPTRLMRADKGKSRGVRLRRASCVVHDDPGADSQLSPPL
jgi:hypothetical protein